MEPTCWIAPASDDGHDWRRFLWRPPMTRDKFLHLRTLVVIEPAGQVALLTVALPDGQAGRAAIRCREPFLKSASVAEQHLFLFAPAANQFEGAARPCSPVRERRQSRRGPNSARRRFSSWGVNDRRAALIWRPERAARLERPAASYTRCGARKLRCSPLRRAAGQAERGAAGAT